MDEHPVPTSAIHDQQEAVNNASSLSSFAALLMLTKDYLTQQRYSEAVPIFAQLSNQFPFPHTDFLISLETFLQEHRHYLLAENTLKETCVQFAEASAALTEQAMRLGECLQTFIQDLETQLPSLASHTDSSPDPPGKSSRNSSSSPPPVLQNEPPNHAHFSSSATSPNAHRQEQNNAPAELFITCFNHFEVRFCGKALPLCSSLAGQAILRYLVAKADHRATSDTLKDLFWPLDEPEAAQRKLHHAISSLRLALNHCLPAGPRRECIIFKAGLYTFSPLLTIHTDVDDFLQFYRAGQGNREQQASNYEKACQLYKGSFLIEDLYSDWSALQREQLSRTYFTMCRALTDHCMQHGHYEDAEKWAIAVLKENPYDETCHRQLMRIYAAQGRRSDAIRQYRQCESILRELAVQPLPETTSLLQTILTTKTEPERSTNGEPT